MDGMIFFQKFSIVRVASLIATLSLWFQTH